MPHDRVVKVALKHMHADFDDPVAYHGLRVDDTAPLPSKTWRGGLRPLTLVATGGCHGDGVCDQMLSANFGSKKCPDFFQPQKTPHF